MKSRKRGPAPPVVCSPLPARSGVLMFHDFQEMVAWYMETSISWAPLRCWFFRAERGATRAAERSDSCIG
jgi:hypothetical protein